MPGKVLLSTAYLPPAGYFCQIKNADKVLIEREENYIKQTFRNRCSILAPDGILNLSVPVRKGPSVKTPLKTVEIDYTKRWQQVHLRALISSYSSASYFQYYFDAFEQAISSNHRFLFDLNMELLHLVMKILKINKEVRCTSVFETAGNEAYDFRYSITPKKRSDYSARKYVQVFDKGDFVPGLSIIDLIFNKGPESAAFL